MVKKYIFDTLLDDIQNSFEELADDAKASDKAKRDNKHKLIILQMLIKQAQMYSGDEYDDDEKLRRDIEIKTERK